MRINKEDGSDLPVITTMCYRNSHLGHMVYDTLLAMGLYPEDLEQKITDTLQNVTEEILQRVWPELDY